MSVVTEMYREWYFGGFSDCGEGVIFVAGEASMLRMPAPPGFTARDRVRS
jgi:hypothetical protein